MTNGRQLLANPSMLTTHWSSSANPTRWRKMSLPPMSSDQIIGSKPLSVLTLVEAA